MEKFSKYNVTIGLILLTSFGFSKNFIDTTLKVYENLNVKSHWVTEKQNSKLIIYLHGGVNNPIFKNPEKIKLSYLIENNTSFIKSSKKNGFDLFIPITNDSLNWVSNYEYCFRTFKQIIDSCKKEYSEIYISGFSDGGTGSYRIFYRHSEYFNGLIIFNGFPQHQNFNKLVDYSKIKDKKIFYFGTKKDKIIPYEFLLIEYAKQKMSNSNSYIYVKNGGHSFYSYNQFDFNQLFIVLKDSSKNNETIPIHGFIKNDKLISFYKMRRKIIRKYGLRKEILKENQRQKKMFSRKK